MPAPGSRAVLFDVDGTLVDTTYLHTLCWSEALRQYGHDVTMSWVHHQIGAGSEQLLANLLGDARDRSEDDAIDHAHLTLYKQYWGRLKPLPGAVDLLRRCRDEGMAVVLASSASQEELDALRSALDADALIDAATSASDADAGKPAPDIVESALQAAGVAAGRAVFVGDAVWDGIATGNAGVTFVGVTCGGTSEAALRAAGALEVWQHPAALCAGFGTSRLSHSAGQPLPA